MSQRGEQLLDKAIAQARELTVRPGEAEAWARETMRWARVVDARSRRARWAVPALVAAVSAAAIAVLLWRLGPEQARGPAAPAITDVGERVAIAPEPGARFSIVESSPSLTEIRVAAGGVSARLYGGAGDHRLVVAAGQFRFEATGTIYTVVAPEGGAPYAIVHEGTVDVVDQRGERSAVAAGAAWPATRPADRATPERAAERLRRHRAPGRAASAPPAPDKSAPTAPGPAVPAPPDASADAGAEDGSDEGAAGSGSRIGPRPMVESSEDTWRRARLLRGQGNYREALRALAPLAAGRDPTWAPIAQLERMRIAETMSDPRAVRDLGAEFRARWPGHALRGEADALFCAAHRQLGAAPPADCRAPAPRP
jgi:hypothetical protein